MTVKLTLQVTRKTLNLQELTLHLVDQCKSCVTLHFLLVKEYHAKFAFAYQDKTQVQNRQNVTLHLGIVADNPFP